ncbi:hypothetical protein CLOBOL_03056 [Enterocloster bolteae ATCC BAA-613]|uniref:Uncharacterized protein n=1 Tax=Enterocloster bolteae (strain ATCC BAA-613 / DSM 15670 / CCUG 46953 / JCM 12243 / WAL 16351) TaxID=411902 RepID=A8RRP6_ENTBW|nr:hypothetical protein CLOBOL_03056 [Enterocloster bolteae ATCC BAA-613]
MYFSGNRGKSIGFLMRNQREKANYKEVLWEAGLKW